MNDKTFTDLLIWAARRISDKKQKLLTIRVHLCMCPVLPGSLDCPLLTASLVFCKVYWNVRCYDCYKKLPIRISNQDTIKNQSKDTETEKENWRIQCKNTSWIKSKTEQHEPEQNSARTDELMCAERLSNSCSNFRNKSVMCCLIW